MINRNHVYNIPPKQLPHSKEHAVALCPYNHYDDCVLVYQQRGLQNILKKDSTCPHETGSCLNLTPIIESWKTVYSQYCLPYHYHLRFQVWLAYDTLAGASAKDRLW